MSMIPTKCVIWHHLETFHNDNFFSSEDVASCILRNRFDILSVVSYIFAIVIDTKQKVLEIISIGLQGSGTVVCSIAEKQWISTEAFILFKYVL